MGSLAITQPSALPPLPCRSRRRATSLAGASTSPTGRITLVADYGSTKLEMRAGEPQPVPGGRRYAGNADGRVLVVTVLDRRARTT